MTDLKTTAATKLFQIFQEAYTCSGTVKTAEVWKKVLKFNPEYDGTIEDKYFIMLQHILGVKCDQFNRSLHLFFLPESVVIFAGE